MLIYRFSPRFIFLIEIISRSTTPNFYLFSVTKWLDSFLIFGHLQQWKLAKLCHKFAKVGSGLCQIGNKPSKICQSGEISPNLVSLYLFSVAGRLVARTLPVWVEILRARVLERQLLLIVGPLAQVARPFPAPSKCFDDGFLLQKVSIIFRELHLL